MSGVAWMSDGVDQMTWMSDGVDQMAWMSEWRG